MKIAIGNDHAAVEMKMELKKKKYLRMIRLIKLNALKRA